MWKTSTPSPFAEALIFGKEIVFYPLKTLTCKQ